MFTTFDSDSLAIMPVFFCPTTVLLVDDDPNFLKQLSIQLTNHFPVLAFSDPDKAITFFDNNNEISFKNALLANEGDVESLVFTIRNTIYNPNRFQKIIVCIIDYDMPNKSGFDVIKNMGATNIKHNTVLPPSYVLLTGKRYSEINEELAQTSIGRNFISKWDPDYFEQLLEIISTNSASIFQWSSYEEAITVSRNPTEKSNFLFDGHFLPVLNDYIEEHRICELYLFDKQGSYLFLNEDANLSWLFVRNEVGMQNSIKIAEQYHAPKSVINALKEKKSILSLYETKDIESRKTIDWDRYLLPATLFESDDKYTSFFKLNPQSNYYYAFTDSFPEHGIQHDKILSYKAFLDKNSQ